MSIKKPLSLTTRLTLFISITTIIIFLITDWLIEHSVINYFHSRDLIELRSMSHLIETKMQNRSDKSQDINFALQRILAVNQNNMLFYITNDENQTIYYSPGIRWLDVEKKFEDLHNPNTLLRWQEREATYHIIDTVIQDNQFNNYNLFIAIPINYHLNYLEELHQSFLVIIFFSSLVVFIVAWFTVYQGHAPLRRLSKDISNLSANKLNIRLDNSKYPIELTPLISAFNRLLNRIEDVFKRQSNYSADIAHEMRTPITNLITQNQIVLSQQREVNEYIDTLYSNLEEYEHIRKMVNDMLFLSQADNHLVAVHFEYLDLNRDLLNIIDYYEAWAEEQQHIIQLTGTAPSLYADKSMLRRAFGNLLSNAIRYSAPKSTITVELSSDLNDKHVIIRFKNPGEKIAPEHLPHLFERFYRVDPSRQKKTEGTGIGLAIVKSIIDLHHGDIFVTSNEETCFTIILPTRQEH